MIILVVLFRKTKPHHKKSSKLEETLQKMIGHVNLETNAAKNPKTTGKSKTEKNNFKFPWHFKIILYIISLVSMGFSILFVLFKGKKINSFFKSVFAFNLI